MASLANDRYRPLAEITRWLKRRGFFASKQVLRFCTNLRRNLASTANPPTGG
jgi:hypothetical protein